MCAFVVITCLKKHFSGLIGTIII